MQILNYKKSRGKDMLILKERLQKAVENLVAKGL